MELKKAKLFRLRPKSRAIDPDVVDSADVDVQFNPQTLRLTLANTNEGGETRGRQERQFTGHSSSDLSFDLHFDTSDEGTDALPVSVRTRTAIVEQFVVPKIVDNDPSRRLTPPRVQFVWGDLTLSGIISSVTLDFDHFAPDGSPLRAKMGVSIKEQDPRYQIAQASAGAGAAAQAAGAPSGAAPGSAGGGGDRSADALAGESAADFAARQGLDPAAWRGLAGGLDGTLSLSAGLAVGFSAGLSAGVGLGVSAGVELGASASLEASFGLDVSASAGASVSFSASAEANAGFALSAAGGVSAALASVAIVKSEAADRSARAAFGAPSKSGGAGSSLPAAQATGGARGTAGSSAAALPPSVRARPALPDQPRSPLTATGLPSPSQQQAAGPAPAPPRADPRATSFGAGIPLRPRVSAAADAAADAASGRVTLRPSGAGRADPSAPPRSDDPTVPPWLMLPADDAPRTVADRAQTARRPKKLCGCVGGCSHRGGRR